jgi:hypothetical protein
LKTTEDQLTQETSLDTATFGSRTAVVQQRKRMMCICLMAMAGVNDIRLFSVLFCFLSSVIITNKNVSSLELQQYDDFWQHCVDLSASAEGEITTD